MPVDVMAWLSSGTITSMTNAEEGIYFRLLIHAWNYPDGKLPLDRSIIVRLCKNAKKQHVDKVLRLCFVKEADGYSNPKLADVLSHVIDKSIKASIASKSRKTKQSNQADAERTK